MYNKKLTDSDEIRQTLFMTFPIYKSDIILNPQDYFIFAAYKDDIPLSLAVFNKIDTERVELVSIFTDKQHRNNSIAKELLKFSFEELKNSNVKSVTVVYMDKKPYTDALENILDFLDFDAEILRQSVVKNSIENFEKSARFAKRLVRLPEGFSLKLWEDVSQEDLQNLYDEDMSSQWIHEDLHPSKYLQNHFKEYSTALFYEGSIVGWIITHKLSDDTIRFTCSHVKDEFQHMSFQIRIYNHIKSRLIEDGIKYVSWTTLYKYKPMVNFNQKWMSKYSVYEGMSKERNLVL